MKPTAALRTAIQRIAGAAARFVRPSRFLRASTHGLAAVILTSGGCASTAGAPLREITTDGAPRAAGPYAQGIVANGFLYTAGQIPRDPATSALVTGDIAVQTARVLDNLEAVLKAAGCSFADVVKASVFLADIDDFAAMNEVFARRFGTHRPARTTVEARLPGGRVEIDLIARIPR